MIIIFFNEIIALLLLSPAQRLILKWIVGCLVHEGKARIGKRSIYPVEVRNSDFYWCAIPKTSR